MLKGKVIRNRVTGTEKTQGAMQKFSKAIIETINEVVTRRTIEMYTEAFDLMSSPGPIDGNRSSYGLKGYSSGRGTEIPRRGQVAIHPHTGRMRANLKYEITKLKTKIKGEVGYTRAFAPDNPGRVSSIDWPVKPRFVVREIDLKKEENYQGDSQTEGEPPTKYVPKILLGTRYIVGRNVLRRVLINDIQDSTTLTDMTNEIKTLMENFNVFIPREGGPGPGTRAGGDSPRARGDNPRARGDNPRATGDNPRAKK